MPDTQSCAVSTRPSSGGESVSRLPAVTGHFPAGLRSSWIFVSFGLFSLGKAQPIVKGVRRGESACKPDSVLEEGRPSIWDAPLPCASCGLPGARTSSHTPTVLLGLAPDGVYRAAAVTRGAGELLPHRFTLTRAPESAVAVCFLWHCPVRVTARWALPTTAPCGVRTFLGLDRGRPAGSPHHSQMAADRFRRPASQPVRPAMTECTSASRTPRQSAPGCLPAWPQRR